MPSPRPEGPSTSELEARRAAERLGLAFFLFRNRVGHEHVYTLEDSASRKILVGRDMSADVALVWDRKVSGVHAQLERVGEDWVLIDDGLSKNGTFVNGEQLHGRCKLRDGDLIRTGETILLYRKPPLGMSDETADADTRADLADRLLRGEAPQTEA